MTSFTIDADGVLTSTGSTVDLENRPSDVRLSTNGDYIVISSLTAGSLGLPNDSLMTENSDTDGPDEIVSHPVDAAGMIGARSGSAISSFRDVRANVDAAFQGQDEPAGMDPLAPATALTTFRNLPSPIGLSVTPGSAANTDIVVASETREFNAYGGGPTLPNLEAGSISTFTLDNTTGALSVVSAGADIPASPAGDPNQLTLCWVAPVAIGGGNYVVYVSNTINSLISSFQISGDGTVSLVEQIAAAGDGPFDMANGIDNTNITAGTGMTLGETVFGNTDGFIDLAFSTGGEYLYQLTGLAGTIEVYSRDDTDNSITLIQSVDEETASGPGNLPTQNTQGIDAF